MEMVEQFSSQQEQEVEALVSSMPDHDIGEGNEVNEPTTYCNNDDEYGILFMDLLIREQETEAPLTQTQNFSPSDAHDLNMLLD